MHRFAARPRRSSGRSSAPPAGRRPRPAHARCARSRRSCTPLARMSRIVSTSSWHSLSVSPPAISSRSSRRGSVASARASSSRLRSSSVSVPARRLASGSKPGLLEHAVRICPTTSAIVPVPAMRRADQQVLEDRQLRERLRDLERAAMPARRARLRRGRGDVLSREADHAGIRRQRAGDQVEQRDFAGAVRADDAKRRAFARSSRSIPSATTTEPKALERRSS